MSGALQDYDRSLVVGETTFGKALVQSVYRVSGGAGLALTTARYYTPSGRLIQRPWDGTFDEYLTYTLKDQTERAKSADQLKYTTAGRKVYSGGGIEPDLRFDGPVEGFNPTRFGRTLYGRGFFQSYAEQFSAEGDARIGHSGPSRRLVKKGFAVDDAMVADFKKFVASKNLKIEEDAWTKDARVHPRDDSLRDRRIGIRHCDRETAPDHRRPAGEVRDLEVPRSREASRAQEDDASPSRSFRALGQKPLNIGALFCLDTTDGAC